MSIETNNEFDTEIENEIELDTEVEPEITNDEDDLDYYQLDLQEETESVATEAITVEHTVAASEVGERLDKLIVGLRPELSRSHIQRLIDEEKLMVNGKPGKSGYKLRNNDKLKLIIPPPAPLLHLQAENIPLDIIYEDADIIVINKPAGLVVHPAPGHSSGTLVNALLYHVPGLNINGNQRPGIVHRLDKDTSGLLVVAKHDAALGNLVEQMKNHETTKVYLTLVEGGDMQPPEGIIDAPIGRDATQRKQMDVVARGKPARTHYKVLEYLTHHTYIQAQLETGRTHQIRVHFAHLRHPVVGDTIYGRRKPTLNLKRQFLHAHKLGLKLPSSGEYREFESPLPPDLQKALDEARQQE